MAGCVSDGVTDSLSVIGTTDSLSVVGAEGWMEQGPIISDEGRIAPTFEEWVEGMCLQDRCALQTGLSCYRAVVIAITSQADSQSDNPLVHCLKQPTPALKKPSTALKQHCTIIQLILLGCQASHCTRPSRLRRLRNSHGSTETGTNNYCFPVIVSCAALTSILRSILADGLLC